jgi:hypothetical protein
MSRKSSDVRPPNPPWVEINPASPPSGYLSFFLSDTLSGLPVRGVTLPGNNKSDPNLETATYGMFSTCAQGMRASIVKRQIGLLFFTTRRAEGRVLAGYYRIRWYAPTPVESSPPDFALAADTMRFVFPALRAKDLPRHSATVLSKSFRIFKQVDAHACEEFTEALENRPDATPRYLAEIQRLERFNLAHTGYRYAAWRQQTPFGWDIAPQYLRLKHLRKEQARTGRATTSPTNRWQCGVCKQFTINKALLKRCPHCGEMGRLEAVGN